MSTAAATSHPVGCVELLWWSEARISTLTAKIEAVRAEWAAAWGCEVGDEPVRGANAFEAEARIGPIDEAALCGQCAGAGEGAAAWLGCPAELAAAVGKSLFAAAPAGSMAAAISRAALSDFFTRLNGVLRLPPAAAATLLLPAAWKKRWSGALCFAVPLCGSGVVVWVAAHHARHLLGRAAPPAEGLGCVRLLDAITLPLSATFPPCSVPLSALRGLQVGDVLRLPHRLDAPLHLTARGMAPMPVWLGKTEQRRAVQIERAPDSPQT